MRWLVVVLFVLAGPLWAQTYPDYSRITITDQADLLSDAQEQALDARLTALRRQTGIELAVLTLTSQTPYAPDQSLESFATGLFNHWGIGDAKRNDGILVLVLSQDRAMRIELGAGYGRDWDRVASSVIKQSFVPSFSSEDYATGITNGVDDVIASIAQPFHDGSAAPASGGGISMLMVFAAIAGSIVIVARRGLSDVLTRLRRCPVCGNRTLRRKRKTLHNATRTSQGSGEMTTWCTNCDYRNVQPFFISQSTSPSRSSFGGGRSGGGGASGRW